MHTVVERALHFALIVITLRSTLLNCCAAVPWHEQSQTEDDKMDGGQDMDGLYPAWLADQFDLGNDTDYQGDRPHITKYSLKAPRLFMLYSRTGYHLQLLGNGTVTGTNSGSDKFAQVEIISVRPPTIVAIKGVYSGKYLAMNKRGVLYGTSHCPITQSKTRNCHFSEAMNTGSKYNTYKSVKYPPHRKRSYYVALDRRGKPLRGPQTKPGRKSVLFLPRHLDSDDFEAARTHLSRHN